MGTGKLLGQPDRMLGSSLQLPCMKMSPISFASRSPFPPEAKEIGDVCTQATFKLLFATNFCAKH